MRCHFTALISFKTNLNSIHVYANPFIFQCFDALPKSFTIFRDSEIVFYSALSIFLSFFMPKMCTTVSKSPAAGHSFDYERTVVRPVRFGGLSAPDFILSFLGHLPTHSPFSVPHVSSTGKGTHKIRQKMRSDASLYFSSFRESLAWGGWMVWGPANRGSSKVPTNAYAYEDREKNRVHFPSTCPASTHCTPLPLASRGRRR